jgi:hypothetical protein
MERRWVKSERSNPSGNCCTAAVEGKYVLFGDTKDDHEKKHFRVPGADFSALVSMAAAQR